MYFGISNNPLVRLECGISNWMEDRTQKIWLKKPHHVRCRLCGRVLSSDESEYSPEQCGWRRLKDKYSIYDWGWLCHSCDGHFESHFVSIDDISEKEFDRLQKKGIIPEYIWRPQDK